MAAQKVARSDRQTLLERHRSAAAGFALSLAGSLIASLGAGLAIGAAFSSFEASSFMMLAGFGLVVSGALLARRHPAGAWAYLAVFALTVAWSLQGAGLGGSPLPYRLAGPILMLVMIAALMPLLGRWSAARSVSVCAALIIATVTLGILASNRETASGRFLATHFPVPPVKGVQE